LMLNLSRYLALATLAVALFVQPALAHAHYTGSHHGAYRHGHAHAMAASRRHHEISRARVGRLHWRHGLHAFARTDFAEPFGSQYPQYADGYSASVQSWQPRVAATNFSNRPYLRPYLRPDLGDAGPASGWRDTWNRDTWNSEGYAGSRFGGRSQLQGMAEQQASANGVPVSLVDRVIKRESGGNPRAVSRGNYGLMQIRLGTARAMGYGGSAAGLLDPTTNMTFAVRYLAGAYHAAGGNESRAVALYARGYNAVPRVQNASFYGPAPEGGAAWQSPGFDDWSGGGYAPASYRPRLRRHVVF
jgi:hypothetical protein